VFESVRQDLRFAGRSFSAVPGLTCAIVASIALGISANTTVFSLVNELLLREIAAREPDQLVILTQGRSSTFSLRDYEDYRAVPGLFQGLSAHCPIAPANLNANGKPERIWGQLVSGNYFNVVGAELKLGRGIQPQEDEVLGRDAVVVLGHSLWRRLGADPELVGRTVVLNGMPYTVVGVTVPGYFGTDRGFAPEFWAPLAMRRQLWPDLTAQSEMSRTHHFLEFTGRLRRDVPARQAEAALSAVAARAAAEEDKSKRPEPVILTRAGHFPEIQKLLAVILSALGVVVLLVLLIACANVANLLLARAATRQREIGVRLALGASRGRLIRQMLTESVLLSTAGALLGLLLSVPATSALARFQLPIDIPIRFDFSPDHRVLAFTSILAVLTGVMFGLVPAFAGSRNTLGAVVRGGSSGPGDLRRGRLSALLVGLQVTLSLVLLIASGLFLRSLQHASAIDLGFKPAGMLVLSVDTKAQGYSLEKTGNFFRTAAERISSVPEVSAVSYANFMPLSMASAEQKYRNPDEKDRPDVNANEFLVGAHYFKAMGIPLLHGRDFEHRHDATSSAALINRAMANQLFGNSNPIGRYVRQGDGAKAKLYQIIGLVADSKAVSLGETTRPCIFHYLPADFTKINALLGTSIIVRASDNPAQLANEVRRQIESIDPNLAVFNIGTMGHHVDKALMLPRVCAALFGIFGLAGLILASVGLYGVVNYSIRSRTREIGIRMALGARPSNVGMMAARQGMTVVIAATALGLAISLVLSRFTASLLYGIQANDLLTFLTVPAILSGVALVAILIPVRRASRLDPMTALRQD
jgi:predicted permease